MKNKLIMANEIVKEFEKWADFSMLKALIEANKLKQINRYFYCGFVGLEVAIVTMIITTNTLASHSFLWVISLLLMLISMWAMLKADKLLKLSLRPILEKMGFEASTVDLSIQLYQRSVLVDIFNNYSYDSNEIEVHIARDLSKEEQRIKNSRFYVLLPFSILLSIISILSPFLGFKDTAFLLISVIVLYFPVCKLYHVVYALLYNKHYRALSKISAFLPDIKRDRK